MPHGRRNGKRATDEAAGFACVLYLDHFVEMLQFVERTYGTILTEEHRSFIERFHSLSKDAQCLLIRMVNPSGAIFNRSLFKYAEISDLERAACDLMQCGQARSLRAEDYSAFVACLPKDALLSGVRAAGFDDIRSSWSKPVLLDYFLWPGSHSSWRQNIAAATTSSRSTTRGPSSSCSISISARPRKISRTSRSATWAFFAPTRSRHSARALSMAMRRVRAFIIAKYSIASRSVRSASTKEPPLRF